MKMLHNSIQSLPQKWAALLFFFLLIFNILKIPTCAVDIPEAPAVPDTSRAQAVLLYNKDVDAILFEQNADQILFPASTVKIMTGYLAAKLLEDRFDEEITISAKMIEGTLGNRLKLSEFEKITIRDLFFAAVCGGYNDACNALAVIAAGSVESFVEEMNRTAADLGMTSTVYKNPTGMHNLSMVTTARDLLKLSLAAANSPIYMGAASTVRYTIPKTNLSAERSFYNRNYLIASAVTTAYHNPYAQGLNAGMTDEGGWCLSTKAVRNDMEWFCIVLGGEEDADSGTIYSYEIANRILSWGARGYAVQAVAEEGSVVTTAPILYPAIGSDLKDGVKIVASAPLSVFAPINPAENGEGIETVIRLHSPIIEAPFPAGKEVGVLIATWNGVEVGRVTLVTAEAVERNHFTYTLSLLKALPQSRIFRATLVIFLLLLIAYLLIVTRFRRPRRRRRPQSPYVPTPFRPQNGNDAKQATTKNTQKQNDDDPYGDVARHLEKQNKS